MQWQLVESGRMKPHEVMQKDAALLQNLSSSVQQPILHFYEWESRCLTYGYFMDPDDHLDVQALRDHRLLLARRPTGGGIIFHVSDFAFSLLMPASAPGFSLNTLENYQFVNQRVAQPSMRFRIFSFTLNFSPQRS